VFCSLRKGKTLTKNTFIAFLGCIFDRFLFLFSLAHGDDEQVDD